MKIVISKNLNPSIYTNKQQNIKTFRYDWKLVDRNCPEYGMCLVYGELTLCIGTKGKFVDAWKMFLQKSIEHRTRKATSSVKSFRTSGSFIRVFTASTSSIKHI